MKIGRGIQVAIVSAVMVATSVVLWQGGKTDRKPAEVVLVEPAVARAQAGTAAGEPGSGKVEWPGAVPRSDAGNAAARPDSELGEKPGGEAGVPAAVPLLHLVNRSSTSFYTLSRSEIYRLTKVGDCGRVLTPSTLERNRLVSSGKFENEGVLGYAAARPAEGTVFLSRYRGNRDWRVEFAAPHGNPEGALGQGRGRLDVGLPD